MSGAGFDVFRFGLLNSAWTASRWAEEEEKEFELLERLVGASAAGERLRVAARARRAAMNDRTPRPRYATDSTAVAAWAKTAPGRSAVPSKAADSLSSDLAVPNRASRPISRAACMTCMRSFSLLPSRPRTSRTTPMTAGIRAGLWTAPVRK